MIEGIRGGGIWLVWKFGDAVVVFFVLAMIPTTARRTRGLFLSILACVNPRNERIWVGGRG